MRAARQGQLCGIKRLVLAGAPDVRQKQVEVELLWQVESRRAARGGHLEGRRGDGDCGFGDGDEAKRGEHGGREADDKHAGAVRAAKADVPLAGQLALALLTELEDDAECKATGQKHVGEACKRRIVGVLEGADRGEDGEVEDGDDNGDN